MKFTETDVAGGWLIELNCHEDSRGFFARLFCREEFEAHGLDPDILQINTGYSSKAGTVRGLHFQRPPFSDNKLVKCLKGAIMDVCIDLRAESPTYMQSFSIELNDQNRLMHYLPSGCAHGYQTLLDDTEIMYTTNRPYEPNSAAGLRYNDPSIEIIWPRSISSISDADRTWPDYAK